MVYISLVIKSSKKIFLNLSSIVLDAEIDSAIGKLYDKIWKITSSFLFLIHVKLQNFTALIPKYDRKFIAKCNRYCIMKCNDYIPKREGC